MLSRISSRFPEDVCSDLLVFAKPMTQLSNNATPIEGNWMLAMSDRGEIAGASEWYHYSALATIVVGTTGRSYCSCFVADKLFHQHDFNGTDYNENL